jgi:1-acyl-sn-glycerol-3-phosphate acyltransferase
MTSAQSRNAAALTGRRADRLEVQAPPSSARRYRLVRGVMRLLTRAFSRVLSEGFDELPPGPAILCFSHQSWADPFYLFAVAPKRPRIYFFGPEQEDMRHGIRNRIMRWSGVTIPYQPGKRGLVSATARVDGVLARGSAVAIAGEGRIHSGEGAILPLRDGPAYLALRAGVPVIPVALNGTSWLGFRRVVRIRAGCPLSALPAIPSRPSSSEVRRLTAETQVALEKLVADFPERPRPGPFGRWLTEVFNDWPDGVRPTALPRSDTSRVGEST